jgi:hypothetical protein
VNVCILVFENCTPNILLFGTLFQQDIAAAGDLAVLVYREETKPEDVTQEGIAAAMKMGIKERTSKLIIKLGKMTPMANPAHGPEFLQEVLINLFLSFFLKVHCISVAHGLNHYFFRLRGIGQ